MIKSYLKQLSRKKLSSGRGGVIHEYVLVIPVLLVFVIGIIDVARAIATLLVLQYGANEGVSLAAKLQGLQNDYYDYVNKAASDDLTPDEEGKALDYYESLQQVVAAAIRLPSSTMCGTSRLRGFNYTGWDNDGPTTDIDPPLKAAFIRPGDPDLAKIPFASESPGNYGYATDWDGPQLNFANQRAPQLMRDYPLVVYLECDFKWFLPFVKDTVLVARGVAYRELVWDGAVPEGFNPPLEEPTRTPTNTFTPTRTATNTRTITNTPTISNTPTITNTPGTPTVTRTPTITRTPTQTRTPTVTNTPGTPTVTRTPTMTRTRTATRTNTSTATPTNTSSNTFTPSATPTYDHEFG